MKKSLYIFSFFLLIQNLVAQIAITAAPAKTDQEIFTVVEQPAEFPGGMNAMIEHIQKKLVYPVKARDLGIGGKVFLKFVVNEDGSISDIAVLKSCGVEEMDEEARRVVAVMPGWKPAMQSGKTVKCYFNLPISFALSTPYMIFNTSNNNADYLSAKETLLRTGDLKSAISYYEKNSDDPDSCFNLAAIHWMNNNKRQAKHYYENVRSKSEPGSNLHKLSDRFLTNNF